MKKVREVIVVEGRYDKNTVSQVVDALIIETSGFGIFKDNEKQKLLRTLAENRGLVLFMDSDGAGFLIRGRLMGIIGREHIKHAYIPDMEGKERRKTTPSKEGKLGLEGMPPKVIIEALERAGVTFEDETEPSFEVNQQHTTEQQYATEHQLPTKQITKADLYMAGLSGLADSAAKRRALQKRLGLPEAMSANALLDVLNTLYTREQFIKLLKD